MSIRVSAVICTQNRAGFLKKAIKSLEDQACDPDLFEIVVVDNRSTDSTKEVASELSKSSKVGIKYVYEGNTGLSYARNAGIENSEGGIIAFLDDDATAVKGWVKAIIDIYDKDEFWVLGGPIEADWGAERPAWLSLILLKSLSVIDYGPEQKDLDYPREWIGGGNTAYRREVFTRYGTFYSELGRKGKSLLSGEEIDLFDRMLKDKRKMLYSPEMRIKHYIHAERLKKRWFMNRFYSQGRSEALSDHWRGNSTRIEQRKGMVLQILPVFLKRFIKDMAMKRQETLDAFLETIKLLGYKIQLVRLGLKGP
ncbi:MAG: glycosyltransferase family 2 protein [Thermodesulfobacteriota bacterium]